MAAIIVFKRMLALFLMMAAGFICAKIGWTDKDFSGKLSRIVVNVLNPMLVLGGVINKERGDDLYLILSNLCMMIIYFVILFILGALVVRLLCLKGSQKSLYHMMMIFSNVGFMGIPVISSVYGDGCILLICFYILGYNLLLYTLGVYLTQKSIEEDRADSTVKSGIDKETLKKILNPGFLACFAAIAIFAFKIPVFEPVADFVSTMGNTAVPLSMFLIGVSVSEQSASDILSDKKIYPFLLIRLIVIPVVMAFLVKMIPVSLPEMVKGVFIMMLAMPVGSIVVLMATEQGADEACCVRGNVLSTLAAVLTIPVVAMML
ncbi:MAG TPA: hypothetical protein DCG85_04430 [Lachnospiraceae bacterium]|nr:hypothetical protein [Lachnospiraceae bacterium]